MATKKQQTPATPATKKLKATTQVDDKKKDSAELIESLNSEFDQIQSMIESVAQSINKKNSTRNKNVSALDAIIKTEIDNVKTQLDKIDKHQASDSVKIDKQTKLAISRSALAIKVLGSLNIVLTPTELTVLARFLDFWDASVSKLLNEKQLDRLTAIEDVEIVKAGFRDKKGDGFVSREAMGSFMNALYLQLKSNPEASVNDIISSMRTSPDTEGIFSELKGITDVLTNLMGASSDGLKLVDFESSFSISRNSAAELNTLNNIVSSLKKAGSENPSNFTGDSEKVKKKNESLQKKVESLLQLYGSKNLTLIASSGSGSRQVNSKISNPTLAQILRTIKSRKLTSIDFTYEDTSSGISKEVSLSQSLKEKQDIINAYKADENARRFNAEFKNVSSFLRGITVTTQMPDGKSIESPLFGNDVERIGALFYAAYFNLPKFAVSDVYASLGTNESLTKLLGSEALPAARQNLARILTRIVYETVSKETRTINVPDVVYNRENKRGIRFGKGKEDIIEQILYGLSPTGFPTDWTFAASVNQTFGLEINGKTYSIMSKNALASGFMSDPSGGYAKINDAQGDHAIALSMKGKTIPVTLSSLSSAENQSKLDNETGRSQILQRSMVYGFMFERDGMGWEDSYNDLNALGSAEREILTSVNSSIVEARKSSFKWPNEEIEDFKKEVSLYNRKSDIVKNNSDVDSLFRLYSQVYEKIDRDYSELKRLHNELMKKINTKVKASGASSLTIDFSSESRQLSDVEKRISDLHKRLNSSSLIASKDKTAMLSLYKNMIKLVNEVNANLKSAKSLDADMVLKGDLMEYMNGLGKEIDSKRVSSLALLNLSFADISGVFDAITRDLSKGPQSYRGSRIVKAGKGKMQLVAPTPTGTAEYISKNISNYRENIKAWNKNEKTYKDRMGVLAKLGSPIASLESLQDFLKSMFEARQYLYFSEFFE